MNGFLTLEDVNSTIRSYGVNVQYYEIDTSKIGDYDFTDVKYDFCTITRIYRNNKYNFYVTIDNNLWTGGYYVLDNNHEILYSTSTYDNGVLYIGVEEEPTIIIGLVLQGDYTFDDRKIGKKWLDSNIVPITLNELNTSKSIRVWDIQDGEEETYSLECDVVGVKKITAHRINAYIVLIKTDFQFNCTQTLTVGKVNKVALGTDSDYLPDGDMIGDNTPNIKVLYGNTYIPVIYDSTLNDYVFNLDLTSKQNEGSVRFKVFVEENDVINTSETEVRLTANYEPINTEQKLQSLFKNGGVGYLSSNITLTSDLTVNEDVYLITNYNHILSMASHKIIVPTDKTLKMENVLIQNGFNTITQYKDSKVELTNCLVQNCTGVGSIIKCELDIPSLEENNDFTTILKNCVFRLNETCIVHGGELTVDNCTVEANLVFNFTNADFYYPYFLYQVDGEATIINSSFKVYTPNSHNSDVGFNSCIFMAGENAIINSLNYTELQSNNIPSFLSSPVNNSSIVDITYRYKVIEDLINLSSNSGFCHCVSGKDDIFKTNVTVRRVE